MNIISLINSLPGAVAQGLIWGLMAIGVYITFKVLDLPDLTVDGTMCTGGAVFVVVVSSGQSVWFGLFCAIIVGMIAGFATGVFNTFMGIPAILSGILTQLALYSINLRILGGKANQAISADKFDLLVSLRNVRKTNFENPIFFTVVLTIILICILYWFFGTELGCSLRATGCNTDMARAQGINTDFSKVLGLMVSNGVVALSSALLVQYQGFVDVNMGRGAIVIGLAAVIIGEVLLSKIFKNFALKLLSVSIGSIIYYLVIQIILQTKLIKTDDLKLLTAVIVAIFLAVPFWKSKYFKKVKKEG